MIKFYKGRAGRKAYEVSKVWKLGPHIFTNSGDLVFRLCYFRNNQGTYYIQVSVKIKDEYNECSCSN